jgi:hypothetical protein
MTCRLLQHFRETSLTFPIRQSTTWIMGLQFPVKSAGYISTRLHCATFHKSVNNNKKINLEFSFMLTFLHNNKKLEKAIIIHIPYNSLAGFQRRVGLTDQTLFIYCSTKNFLTIWCSGWWRRLIYLCDYFTD